MINITCENCKKTFSLTKRENRKREWNLSKGVTKHVFCSLMCSGKFRAIGKDEIKKRHAEYLKNKMANDPIFREKRLNRKRQYYQERKIEIEKKMKMKRTTPEYKAERAKYLASEKYKKYKQKYDRIHRCKKKYGEFWESASILIDMENEIKNKMSKYEIRLINGTINKALNRSRNEGIKRGYA